MSERLSTGAGGHRAQGKAIRGATTPGPKELEQLLQGRCSGTHMPLLFFLITFLCSTKSLTTSTDRSPLALHLPHSPSQGHNPTNPASRLSFSWELQHVSPVLVLLSLIGEGPHGVVYVPSTCLFNCHLSQADMAALQTAECHWLVAINVSKQC